MKKYPVYMFALIAAYIVMLLGALSLVPFDYLLYNWPLLVLLIAPAVAAAFYVRSGKSPQSRIMLAFVFMAWLALMYFVISDAIA